MVFRDIFHLVQAVSSVHIWVLGGSIILLFILTSLLMYVVLKILQCEDVFVRGGHFGFARVVNARLLLWALALFVGLLDVSFAELAWMYLVVFLVTLLSYEFLFDLGALKTSVAGVIEIAVVLLSLIAIVALYSYTGGMIPFVI